MTGWNALVPTIALTVYARTQDRVSDPCGVPNASFQSCEPMELVAMVHSLRAPPAGRDDGLWEMGSTLRRTIRALTHVGRTWPRRARIWGAISELRGLDATCLPAGRSLVDLIT